MPLTISGSTGIAGVDGSAFTPAVQGTDTNTGIVFPAADTVAVATGGTERMRVDSSGNVGIGTSSPVYKLDINAITGWAANQTAPIANIVGANAPTNGGGNLRVLSNTSATADAGGSLVLGGYYAAQTNSIDFAEISGRKQTGQTTGGYLALSTRADLGNQTERMRIDSSGNVGIGTSSPSTGIANRILAINGTDAGINFLVSGTDTSRIYTSSGEFRLHALTAIPLVFYTNNTERARITSVGDLLVGTSSTLFASSHAFVNSGSAVLGLRNSVSTAGKYWQVGPDTASSFKVYNQSNVGMFMADGGTSWSSSSDERQKNIIEPISDAVAKVVSLRAVIGSYKADEENKRRSFLIAQDVEQALPEAVTAAPDGFLGVAYTDVIPLLVAAIQEQQTQIAALEARLTALEAK